MVVSWRHRIDSARSALATMDWLERQDLHISFLGRHGVHASRQGALGLDMNKLARHFLLASGRCTSFRSTIIWRGVGGRPR